MPRKQPYWTRKKLHRRRLALEKARKLTKAEKKEEERRNKEGEAIDRMLEGCGLRWWVQDNYGDLQVTDKDPRWGIAAGPFVSEEEACRWINTH